MFRNNLKFAIRTLTKSKAYSLINILGLAVGIAAALLLYRMVSYEFSFNQNFENYSQLTRVVSESPTSTTGSGKGVCVPIPAMEAMNIATAEMVTMSKTREFWPSFTIPGEGQSAMKKFGLDRGDTPLMVESTFFDIFSLPWVTSPAIADMEEPNSMVLSHSWAEKCFGSAENALNQTMMLDNIYPIKVVGVIEDLPSNCDFSAPFFVSYATLKSKEDYFFLGDHWGSCSSNDQVYMQLNSGVTIDAVDRVLKTVGEEEYSEDGVRKKFHLLQPISDLHYNDDLGNSGSHTIAKNRLKVLALIGLLILLMACFNFINLANAHSTLRAKEVGVRKTLGGMRSQLAAQFLVETALIVVVSTFLGILVAELCAPLLQKVSEVPPGTAMLSGWKSIGFVSLVGISVIFLAGLYPALALASFKPVEALKNDRQNSFMAASSVRKALVVLQFVVAQALIISIIIALAQLKYIRSQDMGFEQDLVYTFEFNSDSSTISRQSALKQSLLQLPDVEAVSLNSDQPFSGSTWASNFYFDNRPEDEEFSITLKFTDEDYQKTYQLEMLAGRWLQPSDTMRECVVNQLLVDRLGFAEASEVIGKTIKTGGQKIDIVGVTDNFYAHSMRSAHLPLMMTTRKPYYWEAGVKIRPENVSGTIASIQRVYDEVLPEQVFQGRFFDENIAQFYEEDQRLASACWGFGLLAIFICCLGLFGLAAHTAARRTKEIGIRKVLGARIGGLVQLLSREFMFLVVIAFLIAIPVAWYFMSAWLNDFVFRIDIPWWSFALAGLVTLLIAFITVGFQTLRAALADPIKSLQSE